MLITAIITKSSEYYHRTLVSHSDADRKSDIRKNDKISKINTIIVEIRNRKNLNHLAWQPPHTFVTLNYAPSLIQ